MIPVGTITLCYCRRALQVTGHDRWDRAYWTHMAALPKVHHPYPLSWTHTLADTEITRLRRENEKLRGAIKSIHDIATGLGRPLHHMIGDILAVTERIETK